MTIEKISYAGNPERVTEEVFDCVWVRLADRKKASPLSSPVLQWVDWKMHGALSRFIQSPGPSPSQTTFVPTHKRLPTTLLALDPPGDLNWKSFQQNGEGLGLKNVLILCEQPDDLAAVEKALRRSVVPGLDRVVLGSDAAGRG